MKFKHYLDNILGQKTELAVLRFLVNVRNEAGVREVAQGVKIGPPNVSRALKALEEAGVLLKKTVGRSVLYRLNVDHYLVKKVVMPLFTDERDMSDELRRFIMKNIKFSVESIILFGSIARGNGRGDSDIDILFILPSKDLIDEITDELLEVNNKAIRYFGNYFSPLIMSKKEFMNRYKTGDELIRNIVRDGRVIEGKLVSELI